MIVPADRAPGSASACAAPAAYAPGADPAPLLRWPAASGWDDAAAPGSTPPALRLPAGDNAAATHSRSRGRSQTVGTAIDSSSRSYAKTKRSFSSITLLAFQAMRTLYVRMAPLQCQESPRFNLSGIYPVRTVCERRSPPGGVEANSL